MQERINGSMAAALVPCAPCEPIRTTMIYATHLLRLHGGRDRFPSAQDAHPLDFLLKDVAKQVILSFRRDRM
jgi:hypothetical protein